MIFFLFSFVLFSFSQTECSNEGIKRTLTIIKQEKNENNALP